MEMDDAPSLRESPRLPLVPSAAEWRDTYEMLCGHCDHQLGCDVIEQMIEIKDGGAWPTGGWVTDPGAGVTCLSYVPKGARRLPRQQMRAMLRAREADLPAVCGGCAARRGTGASVSLHTQRDYAGAVRDQTPFTCHEDPTKERLCGGWCRAVRRKVSSISDRGGKG